MATHVLEVRNLHVDIDGSPVLHDISLRLEPGQTHVLLGPNGSGKSSLLSTIMGLPPFEARAGSIHYSGHDLAGWTIAERARLGMGMAFQRPPSLDGVTVSDLCGMLEAEARFEREAARFDLDAFREREINVGFSGGEIKRWEVMKLVLQDAALLLCDEPESGVDLEHIAAVGQGLARALRTPGPDGVARSALIITHTGNILNHVDADVGHMMLDGRLIHSGDPSELFAHIQAHGYTVPPEGQGEER